MIKLSQRDKRWGWKPIGNTPYLIRDYGCTLTVISMFSDYFKCYKDPAWCAKHLEYTRDARIFWKSVDRLGCLKFRYRHYNHAKEFFLEALKNPKRTLMLEYKHRHWLAALRRIPGGYLAVDPWTGSNTIVLDSSISGGTILESA